MSEPGAATRTITLPRTLQTADRSRTVSTVTLGAADGAVLVDPR